MNELAFYIYPKPKGTNYYEKDLLHERMVKQLFDYYQILLAIIYKDGWEFLVSHYGYEKLYEINAESDCFDCESLSDFIAIIIQAKEEAPYA